jgi:hypothetical protein
MGVRAHSDRATCHGVRFTDEAKQVGRRSDLPCGIPRKVAINNVVVRGTRTNLLPDILRRWFGPDAGKPGTGFKVWLRRRGDRVTMEPMSLARAAEPEG